MTQHLNFQFEVKALSAREFEGHGSVFRNVDLGGDVVVPGAFRRTLTKHQKDGSLPQMFWMHQPDKVAGKWLEMREDEKGLYTKGVLADTPLGNEMHTLLGMKAVRGLSIGYLPVDTDFDKDGNRLIKEIDLWEVSLVSLAMNPLAMVESAKARLSASGEYIPTEREFERHLRNAGCSKSVARTIVARVFDGDSGGMPDVGRRDADDVDDPEAKAVLDAIAKMTDSMWAETFRT